MNMAPIVVHLPVDVLEVLASIDINVENAIIRLVRSYETQMVEAGAPMVREFDTAQKPASEEGYKPSLDAMRRETDKMRAGAHDVPLDPADGLPDWHYILGVGVAIAVELSIAEDLPDAVYFEKKDTLRRLLSTIPEEKWHTEETRLAYEST